HEAEPRVNLPVELGVTGGTELQAVDALGGVGLAGRAALHELGLEGEVRVQVLEIETFEPHLSVVVRGAILRPPFARKTDLDPVVVPQEVADRNVDRGAAGQGLAPVLVDLAVEVELL